MSARHARTLLALALAPVAACGVGYGGGAYTTASVSPAYVGGGALPVGSPAEATGGDYFDYLPMLHDGRNADAPKHLIRQEQGLFRRLPSPVIGRRLGDVEEGYMRIHRAGKT